MSAFQRLAIAIAIVPVLAIGLAGCQRGVAPVSTVGEVEFTRALAIPPLAESTTDAAGRRVFALEAGRGESDLGGEVPTATLGYNGALLGPTLVAVEGETVRIDVRNSLPDTTTVHWHGMHLPAAMDGSPHQPIQPGGEASPTWEIDQPAATLWYHPHPHGETEGQVSRGLAGMFIVRDDREAALDLPRAYGEDDIPVIVQDVRLDDSDQLSSEGRAFVGALGDELLVNGTPGPYIDVTTMVVRLRLLNASTARVYDFAIDDGRDIAVIASDGGLLAAPVSTSGIQLSPGERAEVLVELVPGETAVLRSSPPDLGMPEVLAASNAGADSFDVLELRAAASLTAAGSVPDTLVPLDLPDESSVTEERRFVLDGTQINQQSMDATRIDEVVTLGATEVWNVHNTMAFPHNFHVHDVQFAVLAIGGAAPPAVLAGWKDTVYLRPNIDYRLIMRFTDYADPETPYMYHCHLLAHEDQGMMGQFVVVAPGQRAGTIDQGDSHDQH
jgi:suppressor of ftsI